MAPVPKRRRKPPASALADLDSDLRRDLEHGHGFFTEYKTIEDMQAAWDAVGEELLAAWIEENPGTRPYAWWLLVHRKERPIVAKWADQRPMDRERREARFGFLDTSLWCGGTGHESSYFQQDPTAYLVEHNLLLPGEYERFIEHLNSRFAESHVKLIEWTLKHDPKNPRLLHEIDLNERCQPPKRTHQPPSNCPGISGPKPL